MGRPPPRLCSWAPSLKESPHQCSLQHVGSNSAIIWHLVNMLTVATKESFKRKELQYEKSDELFRKKYIVTNVLHNSANGIIYEGVKRDSFTRVCFKQVARQSVAEVVHFEGQTMPAEFYRHKLCSHLDGVVKVWHK